VSQAGYILVVLCLDINLSLFQLIDLSSDKFHFMNLRSQLLLVLAGAAALVVKLLTDLVQQLGQTVARRLASRSRYPRRTV
jgi:hypothetical protein